MSLYSLAVFLHVTGAIMLGFIIGIEWMLIFRLRNAETREEVLAIIFMMTVKPVFEISAGVLVLSFAGAILTIGRREETEVSEPA